MLVSFTFLCSQDEDDRMVKINELLKMIESQEKAGGESCTPGTELELGENIVDSYGKVRDTQTFRFRNSTLCEGPEEYFLFTIYTSI